MRSAFNMQCTNARAACPALPFGAQLPGRVLLARQRRQQPRGTLHAPPAPPPLTHRRLSDPRSADGCMSACSSSQGRVNVYPSAACGGSQCAVGVGRSAQRREGAGVHGPLPPGAGSRRVRERAAGHPMMRQTSRLCHYAPAALRACPGAVCCRPRAALLAASCAAGPRPPRRGGGPAAVGPAYKPQTLSFWLCTLLTQPACRARGRRAAGPWPQQPADLQPKAAAQLLACHKRLTCTWRPSQARRPFVAARRRHMTLMSVCMVRRGACSGGYAAPAYIGVGYGSPGTWLRFQGRPPHATRAESRGDWAQTWRNVEGGNAAI